MTPTRNSGDGDVSAIGVSVTQNLIPRPTTLYRVVVQKNTGTGTGPAHIIDSPGVVNNSTNEILPIPQTTPIGTVISLNWPCLTGLSAVLDSSGLTLNFSYLIAPLG